MSEKWFGKHKKIPTLSTIAVDEEDLKSLFSAFKDYKEIKKAYSKSFNMPTILERELDKWLQKYGRVLN